MSDTEAEQQSLAYRLNRGFRNRARRVLADAAHAALAFLRLLIHRIGFGRVLAWSSNSRNRLVRSVMFTGLSQVMAGVDPVAQMRLAWRARWYNRDYALVTLVSVLNSQQKNAALLWWSRRPVRTSLVRNALNEFAIETYARVNDLEALEAFVANEAIDPLLRERGLAETALRLGRGEDFVGHLNAMAVAGSERRRPYLRWLLRFVERDQDPAALLPQGSLDVVLATSAVVQRSDDHLALEQILRPPPPASRVALWGEYREAVVGAMSAHRWKEAAELARAPIEPPGMIRGSVKDVALTVARSDCFAAVGDRAAAMELLLSELDNSARSGKLNPTLRLLVQAARRFPSAPELIEQAPVILETFSVPGASSLAEAWLQHHEDRKPRATSIARRCFIVANGPSIASMPLHLLEGEDIFVVNRGTQATSLGLPRPRFLVVSDSAVYRDYWKEIDAAPVDLLFLSGTCLLLRPLTSGPRIHAYGHTALQLSMGGGLVPADGLYHLGASVVLSACQIAHFMGYREINILGVDNSYDGPVSHFYGADARGTQRLASFRTGGYGAKWVNDSFAHLRTFFEANGTVIRNVGQGGNLVTLSRTPLEQALAQSAGPTAPALVPA